ncbi:oligosaccharide flippase family protein [Paraflavisolibacter sp. H34]|uniref:lipopolysaccharide biosynthesis protein n=1 Tax=Huijunlia imazamoxiresistens TaxID=3127457 RepID=UPI00301B0AAF
MSEIKKLAGQTLWYGASSIAARFLNYLLTPYLTAVLTGAAYGKMSLVYAAIPFLNIIFTYGLETAYFRYSTNKEQQEQVYNTATISLICSTILLTGLLVLASGPVASLLGLGEHPEYIKWSAYIIALDALSTLAFAKLRFEGRPLKFAIVRLSGIAINIGCVIFLLSVFPKLAKENPHSFWSVFYNPDNKVGYVILANLVQAGITFLLLSKEFFSFRWQFNAKLWKDIILYSSPLILAGFAGMINETFDRIMLRWWTPATTPEAADFQVGVYSACYKLSILISLFIQAFRMGAEPFFFKQAKGQQPQRTYARVMKFFVITICFMFLVVALFLDGWKYFISNHALWEGLKVVPVLLLANMFLGIYYNLSIWYKLSNKTMAGAWITVVGAVITLLINYFFIPVYGYMACAWATFACYGTMMVISYVWGQKHYPVPYPWKKLVIYILLCVGLYGGYTLFSRIGLGVWADGAFGLLLLSLFGLFIVNVERKEFERLPVVGKYFAPKTA